MFWAPTRDVPGSEYEQLWQFVNQDERKFKMHFWKSLNPLGAQNKDISAASQTLLTWVKFRFTLLTVTYKLTCIAGSFVGEGVSTQMNGEAGRKFLIAFFPLPSQVLICAWAPNKTAVFNSYVPSLQ